MTRINSGIKPTELPNKLLIAEHREIKRIPNIIKKGKYNLDNIPHDFKLGTGHVKFFYNRLKYLHTRYREIYNECINRGINVSYYGEAFEGLPKSLYNDWTPPSYVRDLLIERIESKGFKLKNV